MHRTRRTTTPRRQQYGERGAGSVEILMLAVPTMMLVLVVVAAGRYVDASAQANDAAYAAARAASLHTTAGAGYSAGTQAAHQSLADRGKSCEKLVVSFAGSDFHPGGEVVARVECTASLLDMGGLGRALGLDPKRVFTETAAVPIETYRAGGLS